MSRHRILIATLIFIAIAIPILISITKLNISAPGFATGNQSGLYLFRQGNQVVWHDLEIHLINVVSAKYIREYIESMCRSCGLYQYYYYRARDGNIFVLVKVFLRNRGSSIEVKDISFSLVTDRGVFNRYFLTYGDISYNLTADDIKSSAEYKSLYIYRQLGRGGEALGDVLFQVPIDAKPLALRISLSNNSLDISII